MKACTRKRTPLIWPTWSKCGCSPFNRVRVIRNSKCSLLFRARPPCELRHFPIVLHLLLWITSAISLNISVLKIEADPRVAEAELHQALAREESASV